MTDEELREMAGQFVDDPLARRLLELLPPADRLTVLRESAKCVEVRAGLYDVENIIRREYGAKTLAEWFLATFPEPKA